MIKQPKTGAEPQELLAWIERQGHDLTCVVHKGEDGVEWYVLRAWGMRVWEIDPALAKMGQDVAGVVDVPEREPGSELLIHRDPKTKRIEPEIPATFLCQTREGGFVIVEIEQQITRVLTEKDFVAGLPSLPANSGFALGVKFNTYPIALEVVEVPPGE